MQKTYKTAKELRDHIVNDRNISVPEELDNIFGAVRYNNLIDAYKDIIALSTSRGGRYIYGESITINDFINLSNIDHFVSLKAISYIDRYEKKFKKFISDKICESMVKVGSLDCCDYTLFERMKSEVTSPLDCFISTSYFYKVSDTNPLNMQLALADEKLVSSRIKTIDKIIDLAKGNTKSELNYYSKDYVDRKGTIPFYILVGNLSFSTLITLFELFNKNIQLEYMTGILKMNCVTEKDIKSLSTKHNILRIIRNTTHHHEPLIPFLVKTGYLDFNTKLISLKLLKDVYSSYHYFNNPEINLSYSIEPLKSYTSKKSKKVVDIVESIK